jgi:hypothetical protein
MHTLHRHNSSLPNIHMLEIKETPPKASPSFQQSSMSSSLKWTPLKRETSFKASYHKKTSSLIKNLAKETLYNSFAQAILRIIFTKYLSLKIFWFFCLIICGSLCGYLLLQTLITFLSYPVYTTTSIVHEMPTLFPKITICNSVQATTKFAFEMIKEINKEISSQVDIFNYTQISQLSLSAQEKIYWDVFNIFQARINGGALSDTISRQKLVHSFDDVLVYCYFNFQQCKASDFEWRWDPLYGNCYVFNSGLKGNYRESVMAGALFGLQLAFYVGYNENLNLFNSGPFSFFGFTNIYGLNVIIENNTYLSDKKQNVIALNGGTMNYMSMKRRVTSRLPKPYSECEIDNTTPVSINSSYYNLILNSPYQYSQGMCVTQCMQKKVIEECNCTLPIFLDLYNRSCQTDSQSLCAMNGLWNGEFSKSSILNCIPQCPLECNSTEYDFSVTSQTLAGLKYMSLIQQSQILSSDFNMTPISELTSSNKFVQLSIYYDSLSYTSSVDTPTMGIVSLLGSVGGTLGLFLGVSVLSACELMHVVFASCMFVIDRVKISRNTIQCKESILNQFDKKW